MRRTIVNLTPILDIIMLFLLIFMLTTDSDTNRKAATYDKAISMRVTAEEITKDYISKYEELFYEKNQAIGEKETEILNLTKNYNTKVEGLQQEKINLQNLNTSLRVKADDAGLLRDQLDKKIAELHNAEQKVKAAEQDKSYSKKDNDRYLQEIKIIREKKSELETELRNLKNKLNDEGQRVEELIKSKKNIEQDREDLEKKQQQTAKDLAEKEIQNELLNKQVSVYEQNNNSTNYVEKVEALIEEVGNLKAIKKNYAASNKYLKAEFEKKTGDGSAQEKEDLKKLGEWVKKHFWIIEIYLDKTVEKDGKFISQPYQISDRYKGKYDIDFTPKDAKECEKHINTFIAEFSDGGRSKDTVLIILKAHEEALGRVVSYTEEALLSLDLKHFQTKLVSTQSLFMENN